MTGVTFPPGTLGCEAVAYAARGIKIFPLWHVGHGLPGQLICACVDGDSCGSPGKHPRNGLGGVNQATCDLTQVAAWWRRWPHANIGLAAGANQLAIIDVDPSHGGDHTLATLDIYCTDRGVDLMATRTIRTGSGGLHLYYRAPESGVKNAARTFGMPGVDTRGRGGYVVAPPSLHQSGERYQLIDNSHGLAPWPAILDTLMAARVPSVGPRTPPTTPPRPGNRAARWAAAGLQRECDELKAMTQPNSGRNQALADAACKIGSRLHLGLAETDAYTALVDAASGWAGHTPREIDATVRGGLARGKQNPHPGPSVKAGGA